MRRTSWLAIPLVVLSACTEANDPAATASHERPAFAQAVSCADAPDYTVNTLAELHAALASATAGDVIAIDGVIDVPAGQVPFMATAGVQLTCATAGSGLRADASGPPTALRVAASDVVVHGLTFDAQNALQSAVNVGPAAATLLHAPLRVRITGNQMICSNICAFLVGAAYAVVSDNQMESGAGTNSGVHVQRAAANSELHTNGTRVEGNTILITTPSANPQFGGIRVRDGRGLVVRDNTVIGPWANSIAAVALEESTIEHNQLEGAVNFGIVLGFWPVAPRAVNHITIRNNRIRDAGTAGIHVLEGCYNLLLGNLLQGSPDGVAFGVQSGANTYVGNRNLVSDAGAFDCDGDGINDPNAITGSGRQRTGPLGFAVREGVHRGTTVE